MIFTSRTLDPFTMNDGMPCTSTRYFNVAIGIQLPKCAAVVNQLVADFRKSTVMVVGKLENVGTT